MSIPLKADVYAESSFGRDTLALSAARRFVTRTLADLPEGLLADITMAVDEAVANVIEHAGAPEGSHIDLRLYREHGHVRVIVTNDGHPFDGGHLPTVDLVAHAEAHRTSGLGVFLIHQLMDLVLYRTTREGHQELVMVKNLAVA